MKEQISSYEAFKRSRDESLKRAFGLYQADPASISPTNVLLLRFWGFIPGREEQDAQFRTIDPQQLRDAGRIPQEAS